MHSFFHNINSLKTLSIVYSNLFYISWRTRTEETEGFKHNERINVQGDSVNHNDFVITHNAHQVTTLYSVNMHDCHVQVKREN